MNRSMRYFLHLFINIRKQGFIKNMKNGKNGSGLTFEKCLKKDLDNCPFPDFDGIEIKVRNQYSKFKLHLACVEPDFLFATYSLNEKYGYQPKEKDLRYFYLEADAIQKSRYLKHYFQLYVDELTEKIFLLVFDSDFNLVSNEIFWSFEAIKSRFLIKLNTLAVINCRAKTIDNE
ncbi:MAG: hypothetical protein K2M17_02030, partial [Bacilli bacterium]|nr:hypothetical protein [Bacilli bacterium]